MNQLFADIGLAMGFEFALVAMVLLVPLALGLIVGLLDRRTRPIVLTVLLLIGLLLVPIVWYLSNDETVAAPDIETLFDSENTAAPHPPIPSLDTTSQPPIVGTELAISTKVEDTTQETVTASDAATDDSGETGTAKPGWVESVPRLSDVASLSGLTQFRVLAGPYVTISECDRELEKELSGAMDRYIAIWVEDSKQQPKTDFKASRLDLKMVREVDRFVETRDFDDIGPMQQLHVRYEIKPTMDEHLRERMKQAVVAERLTQTGIGFGGLLALLGISFSYLRYNLATHGVYQRRLKFMAIGAILAVIAAGVLVVRWGPWV